MSRERFIQNLEDAADGVQEPHIAALLRRAAVYLRNVEGVVLDPATDDVLSSLAADKGATKSDLIERILNEWMEQNVYRPLNLTGGNGDSDGAAQR